MNSKQSRQQHIRDLLARNDVHNQEELLALLEAEGVRTTQATVSRDLRDLGVVKKPEGYRLPSGPPNLKAHPELRRLVRESVTRAERSGTLVVLRTRTGLAPAVATEVERADLPTVLGAMAGPETVFVATASAAQARDLLRLVRAAVGRR